MFVVRLKQFPATNPVPVWAYNDAVSIRFQITLPDDLALDLKRAAARQKMPLAQFIRETMEARLKEANSPAAGDPFACIADLVDAPDTDLSEGIDDILYK